MWNKRQVKLVLSCEHASNWLPRGFVLKDENIRASHLAFDPGASNLTDRLKKTLNCSSFKGKISRLIFDLNRSVNHKNFSQPDFFAVFSEEKAVTLFNKYYVDFRKDVSNYIKRYEEKRIVHVSVHSFTRTLNNKDRKVDIGVLYDVSRSQERQLATELQANLKLRLANFNIYLNRPYYGHTDGHVAELRKSRAQSRYLGIELEVCNDLIGAKVVLKGLDQAFRDTFTSCNH